MARFKKTLYNWLNDRHILIIQNEENFSEKATYKFTYAKIIFFAFLSLVGVFALSFYMVTTILKQWFDPRYAERQTRQELVYMTFTLDSLAYELDSRDRFIQSIKKVLKGDVTTNEITETAQASDGEPTDIENLEQIDSAFKSEFDIIQLEIVCGGSGGMWNSFRKQQLEMKVDERPPPRRVWRQHIIHVYASAASSDS